VKIRIRSLDAVTNVSPDSKDILQEITGRLEVSWMLKGRMQGKVDGPGERRRCREETGRKMLKISRVSA
jgi:hypothetical protein